jgi:hypothetical protein
LYDLSQARVKAADPAYAVVALDPVNFEKPYTTVCCSDTSTPGSVRGHRVQNTGSTNPESKDVAFQC